MSPCSPRIPVLQISLLAALLVGCHAPRTPHPPAATVVAPRHPPRTADALAADQRFWHVFHAGSYDEIAPALRALQAAYLDQPRDAITAAHLGWLHIWRLAEHARIARPDPMIADDAVLGRRYFEQAVRLDPTDARYQGFYASLLLTEGTLLDDDELRQRGAAVMKRAVATWPEFNLFTAGYGGSAAPHESARFTDALAAQWRNLEVCLGHAVDRHDPDIARVPRLDVAGARRACTNTEIAPHNTEGFYLNFGDMLVKAGEPDAGATMYRNARTAPEFATWPYREILEARIRDAAANVAGFRQPRGAPGGAVPMIASAFACMACHQQ